MERGEEIHFENLAKLYNIHWGQILIATHYSINYTTRQCEDSSGLRSPLANSHRSTRHRFESRMSICGSKRASNSVHTTVRFRYVELKELARYAKSSDCNQKTAVFVKRSSFRSDAHQRRDSFVSRAEI